MVKDHEFFHVFHQDFNMKIKCKKLDDMMHINSYENIIESYDIHRKTIVKSITVIYIKSQSECHHKITPHLNNSNNFSLSFLWI